MADKRRKDCTTKATQNWKKMGSSKQNLFNTKKIPLLRLPSQQILK